MQFCWNSETEMSNHHGSLKSRTPGRDSTTQQKSTSYFFFPFIRFLLPENQELNATFSAQSCRQRIFSPRCTKIWCKGNLTLEGEQTSQNLRSFVK